MTFYLHPYPYRRTVRRWSGNNQRELGVNIREEDDAYLLSSLVPGLKAEDLNIQVLDDVLRIEGEYQADENEYLLRHRVHQMQGGNLGFKGLHLSLSQFEHGNLHFRLVRASQ